MLQTRALGGEPGNGLLPGGLLWVYGWIPTHYETLGILLLNDETGAITAAIMNDCQMKALNINREVLKRLIRGQGKQPVAWDTLVEVLNSTDLHELAHTA